MKEEIFWRNYFYHVSLIKKSFVIDDEEAEDAAPEADVSLAPHRREARRRQGGARRGVVSPIWHGLSELNPCEVQLSVFMPTAV